jgi:hypothetical protein
MRKENKLNFASDSLYEWLNLSCGGYSKTSHMRCLDSKAVSDGIVLMGGSS